MIQTRIVESNARPAAVKQSAGHLDRITHVVKAVGYVDTAPDFTGQFGVINGAGELLGEVLADRASTPQCDRLAALPPQHSRRGRYSHRAAAEGRLPKFGRQPTLSR